MTFADRLAAITHEFETGDTPPEIIAVLDAHVEYLIRSRAADNALQVGDKAPLDRALAAIDKLTLENFCLHPILVLTWFRGNW
jgi:hypothetical protein